MIPSNFTSERSRNVIPQLVYSSTATERMPKEIMLVMSSQRPSSFAA